ncbi:MAG: hypothetical protein ACRBF0_03060 [Calditrichia bacterium]
MNKHYFIYPILLVLAIACTTNPFGSGDPIQDRSTFSGSVQFSSGAPADQILVWFETFELSVLTDNEGNFSISLPPAETQPGGGLNGVFRAFFYLPDYQLDTARVVLRNGEILFGQEDIADDGTLARSIQLEKLFEITTVLQRSGRYRNETVTVLCQTRLDVAIGKSVEVFSFGDSIASGQPFIAAGILDRINTPADPFQRLIFGENASQRFSKIVSAGVTEFRSNYTFQRCTLLDGDYRIVPFVWARQKGLPEGLINALNVPFETLSLDYLRLPFRERSLTSFQIEPEIFDEGLFPCN